MKVLSVLTSSLLLFSACKKDTDMHTTVKGTVKEAGSLNLATNQ